MSEGIESKSQEGSQKKTKKKSLPDPRLAGISNSARFENIPAPGETADTAEGYILREDRPDQFSVARKMVPYTKSVCPICGVDICEVNKLDPYQDLFEELQLKVDNTLRKHITTRHSARLTPNVSLKEDLRGQWLQKPLKVG